MGNSPRQTSPDSLRVTRSDDSLEFISQDVSQLAEEYIYQSEGFLSSMRAILQTIKDTTEYQNYTLNYRKMVYKKNLAR